MVIITKDIKCDPFYRLWLDDMSNLCKLFCKFIGDNKISFWLGTERGCKRYHVDMVPGVGPRLPKTVKKFADAEAIQIPNVEEALGYVMEGIKQTRMDLKGEVPLIGFAGAPWTLLCYMVQGKGSKDFSEA